MSRSLHPSWSYWLAAFVIAGAGVGTGIAALDSGGVVILGGTGLGAAVGATLAGLALGDNDGPQPTGELEAVDDEPSDLVTSTRM